PTLEGDQDADVAALHVLDRAEVDDEQGVLAPLDRLVEPLPPGHHLLARLRLLDGQDQHAARLVSAVAEHPRVPDEVGGAVARLSRLWPGTGRMSTARAAARRPAKASGLDEVPVEVGRPAGDARPAEEVLDPLARAEAHPLALLGVVEQAVDRRGQVA